MVYRLSCLSRRFLLESTKKSSNIFLETLLSCKFRECRPYFYEWLEIGHWSTLIENYKWRMLLHKGVITISSRSHFPASAAFIRAVRPLLSVMSSSAWYSIKTGINNFWLCFAAKCKGVSPAELAVWTGTPK